MRDELLNVEEFRTYLEPIFPHSLLKSAVFASICGVSRVLSVAPFPKTAVVQTCYLDDLAGA